MAARKIRLTLGPVVLDAELLDTPGRNPGQIYFPGRADGFSRCGR